MPIYAVQCSVCAETTSVYRQVAERDTALPAHCGIPMTRALSAPAVHAEFAAYISPATGKSITSRAARKADLRQSGCIEWEPDTRAAIKKNHDRAVRENIAKIESGVDQIVRDLNSSGRL